VTPRRWIGVVVLAVVALGVGVVAARTLLSATLPAPPGGPPRPPGAPASGPPPGWVEFRDELFSIAYPASWSRRRAGDPEVELLVGSGSASFLVRVVPLNFEVGPANVGATKALTDRVVRSGRRVKLLAPPQRSDLGGLPGYFYLYTFEDERGRTGAHSHYFLFKGDTLYTLVFQVLPSDRLAALAPVFDRIARTFRPT
jgi:hypothetical protein